LEVRTDGLNVRLYLRRDTGAVGWNLDIMDVRRVVMLMEFLAGLAFMTFAFCVVYVFWMVADEQKGEWKE